MSKNNVIKAKIDAKIDPATVSELKPTKATSFIDLVFPSRAPAKSLTKHEGYQNASKPTDHLTPKRFVFRRKVKKLSVLKKKILQVCLMWLIQFTTSSLLQLYLGTIEDIYD